MPRAGLSPDLIVSEAARLADEVGRDRLTLTELAKRFGVAQPSLYKHVNGLDALQRLLAVRVLRESSSRPRVMRETSSRSSTLLSVAISENEVIFDAISAAFKPL